MAPSFPLLLPPFLIEEAVDPEPFKLTNIPLTRSDAPFAPLPDPVIDDGTQSNSDPNSQSSILDPDLSKPSSSPSTTTFEYWDEDEFEGLPVNRPSPETPKSPEPTNPSENQSSDPKPVEVPLKKQNFTVDVVCVSFLIMFIVCCSGL